MVLQLCSSFLLLKQIMVGVFDTADALRRPGASSGGTLRRGDDPPHAPREHHGGPTEVSSGETINKVVLSVVTSFRISRVDKINSTAVVFHALGGEQIRVWNGITTVRLSAKVPAPRFPSAPPTSRAPPSKSRGASWLPSTWPRRRPCSCRLPRAAAGWPSGASTR